MSFQEKLGKTEAEANGPLSVLAGSIAEEPSYSAEDERRIKRKIDMRLIPPLTVLYLMSYLDRSNSQCFIALSCSVISL